MGKLGANEQKLKKFFGNSFAPLRSVAQLAIDIQPKFCDPAKTRGNQETHRISEHISRHVMPRLRKCVHKTILICGWEPPKEELRDAFYKIRPEEGDIIINKDNDSAFRGSDIKLQLADLGITRLIMYGFNAGHCVQKTALDGLKHKFNVCVLEDAVGTGDFVRKHHTKDAIEAMEKKGITICNSQDTTEYSLDLA